MKEKLEKLLRAKQEQRETLNASMIDSETKEERAAIGETLKALADEIAQIETMLAEVDEPADDSAPTDEASADEEKENDERGFNVMATMDMRNGAPIKTDNKEAEARAKAFVESGSMVIDNADARAVLISSGQIATPTEVSGINDVIGSKVSSIVDLVKITDASGMGAYKVAYVDTDATAGAQTEGGEYHAGEPTFKFVEITPQTESIVSYISKQARKQTPLNYQEKVNSSALVALRKRAAKFITDKLVASDLVVEQAVTAIDEKTLRAIALNYGGDESVVGAATLFINKKDLVKFGDVRGTNDKKAVYEITPDASNPNTGVIVDGGLAVPYCIDSNLAEGTIVYGQAQCFELALFSNYEIVVSEDHKITSGLLTIVGDAEFGGDVVVKDGFVVATVGAQG